MTIRGVNAGITTVIGANHRDDIGAHSETVASVSGGVLSGSSNIASYLPRMAAKVPEQSAVIITRSRDRAGRPVYASINFADLEELSNRYAGGLRWAGFERRMRVMVMVRPGFEFIRLIFALFKIGAVPVIIDPGMGIGRMLECIRGVDPQGFVGIPTAQAMRILARRAFRAVRRTVTVGSRWFWGGRTLAEVQGHGTPDFEAVATSTDDAAAILFTSGSTGPAKGVVYEHGMFDAQVRMIQSQYGIQPGEIDLTAFPLFALFSTAMGMTSVIPEMDTSRPARVNPARIVEAIRDQGVTNTFGSPAIWQRVAPFCLKHGIKLPTVRRILIAGAPVPWRTIDQLHQVLSPDADVHTPYGATECLPVSSISGHELRERSGIARGGGGSPAGGCHDAPRAGAGTCVGRPVPGSEVRFIRIIDEAIPHWSDDLLVPEGDIGEIVVSGPVVTKSYFGLARATALAKIQDGNRVWHRMGDVGYRDGAGRLWFCGRKSQRVVTEHGTLFADQCEAILNEHPRVARSALVGVRRAGFQIPVIIIESKPGDYPKAKQVVAFRQEIVRLARAQALTQHIHHVLFHRSLPVDIRHNAKINREAMARWAERRIP